MNNAMLAILGLGSGELIVILVVVLVLFGAKRIPEFAKGLGKGINEFKKASREVTDEIQNAPVETPAKPAAPANPTVAQSAPANPNETKVG
jgi:sec-independent protein translocase protein TatA